MSDDQKQVEPERKSWSREELQDLAKRWRQRWHYERDDDYCRDLGLLISFVTDLYDGVGMGDEPFEEPKQGVARIIKFPTGPSKG